MIYHKKIIKDHILLISSFLIILNLVACNNNSDKVILHENILSFSTFPEEINVTFKELFEYELGNPKVIQLVDSTLIIFNYSKAIESFFYNYDLKSNKLSKGYLNKGRSPNESIGGTCTGIIKNNLWVYDVTLKKIFMIDKTFALNDDFKSFNSYPVKENFYQVALIDSNRYLVCGKNDSKYKIQEIDFSGKLLNEFGRFQYIPEDMPLDALKDAYHSFFYLKPSGDKIALSYLYTDVLEIYNTKEPTDNIAVQGPSMVDLNFKVAKRETYNYMEKNNDIKKTFLAGAVTDEYIYLAYSGLSYAEKDEMDYCKFVFVYDWEGNPVKKLNLDRRISGLAVSKDNKTIYSFDAYRGFIVKAEIK